RHQDRRARHGILHAQPAGLPVHRPLRRRRRGRRARLPALLERVDDELRRVDHHGEVHPGDRALEGAGARLPPDQRLDVQGNPQPAGYGPMKRAPRGFTLLELMVGATISLLVIGAVTGAFLAQNRAFISLDVNRIAPDGTVCASGNGCVTGNAYNVTITSAGGVYTVTVNLRTGAVTPLRQGQVLQFICPAAAAVTMATLATTPAPPQSGTPTLSLVPTPGAAPASNDPTKANGFGANGCFIQPGVIMVLVDRYHYLIQAYAGVPWLVLDTGTDIDGSAVIDAADYI